MSGSQDEARCAGMEMLLHALADGELDAANVLSCEAHLRDCPACAAAFADLRAEREALRRDGVRHRAPERLRGRVLAMVEAAGPAWAPEVPAITAPNWLQRPLRVAAAAVGSAPSAAARRRWPWPWPWHARLPGLALAAGLAAMVALVVPPRIGPEGGDAGALQREVVAGHVPAPLFPPPPGGGAPPPPPTGETPVSRPPRLSPPPPPPSPGGVPPGGRRPGPS